MLVNMKKILEIAEAEGYAIPCINTPNEETVRAVIGAAEELNTPIIIDHAQVHDSLIPIERIGPIMLKYAKEARVPVCVHLDHGSDYEFVMRAVKVGFPSIMYDCSALPFEENVEKVAQFVKFAQVNNRRRMLLFMIIPRTTLFQINSVLMHMMMIQKREF